MNKQKILLCVMAFLLIPVFLLAQTNFIDSISSGDIKRTFRIYVPQTYTGKLAFPLVFALHGNTQTSMTFEGNLKFRPIADTAGFILITPEGLVYPGFSKSGQGWNVFKCGAKQNDVLYFMAQRIDYAHIMGA